MTGVIGLKRAYEPPHVADGMRVLVDRIWPRGLSKASAGVELWLKDVAPSGQLRKWFGHRPERWTEFRRRYRDELRDSRDLERLRALARERDVTLVYAAKDELHNNAVVLAELIRLGPHPSQDEDSGG